MRIKIDTSTKVIQLEQSAKIVELLTLIKKLFPDNEWKEYSIEAVQYIYDWHYPIYIPAYTQPFTITSTGTNETYCIESN